MIKQSAIPWISDLVSWDVNPDDFWNNLADVRYLLKNNEPLSDQYKGLILNVPGHLLESWLTVNVNTLRNHGNQSNINLNFKENLQSKSLISPILSYLKCPLSTSPNTFFMHGSSIDILKTSKSLNLSINEHLNCEEAQQPNTTKTKKWNYFGSQLVLKRCQDKRPPNLKLRNPSDDSNANLSFTPQFSPTKTPNFPKNINEDDVFNQFTPTPPKYTTPPCGIILKETAKKLRLVLNKFGLQRLTPLLIKQEVDLNLLKTLTDNDMIELGISNMSERLLLLTVVEKLKKST